MREEGTMLRASAGFLEKILHNNVQTEDFPGGPVAKTPCSQCRGPGFDPWLGKIPLEKGMATRSGRAHV